MLLPTQIQAIIYHLLMGWVYAFGLSFLISFVKYLRFSILKGFVEILYHVLFTSLMFYGLYQINGGIINAYLFAIFVIGVLIYFNLYLQVFLQFFTFLKRWFRPLQRKLTLVKTKILVIIRLPIKINNRRKANAKKRKTKRELKKLSRKEQKEKASD